MAQIVYLLPEGDRSDVNAKLQNRMLGLVIDEKKLTILDESSTRTNYPSDEHIGNTLNNYAGNVGVLWSGSATNVQEALDEVLATVTGSTSAGQPARINLEYTDSSLNDTNVSTGSFPLLKMGRDTNVDASEYEVKDWLFTQDDEFITVPEDGVYLITTSIGHIRDDLASQLDNTTLEVAASIFVNDPTRTFPTLVGNSYSALNGGTLAHGAGVKAVSLSAGDTIHFGYFLSIINKTVGFQLKTGILPESIKYSLQRIDTNFILSSGGGSPLDEDFIIVNDTGATALTNAFSKNASKKNIHIIQSGAIGATTGNIVNIYGINRVTGQGFDFLPTSSVATLTIQKDPSATTATVLCDVDNVNFDVETTNTIDFTNVIFNMTSYGINNGSGTTKPIVNITGGVVQYEKALQGNFLTGSIQAPWKNAVTGEFVISGIDTFINANRSAKNPKYAIIDNDISTPDAIIDVEVNGDLNLQWSLSQTLVSTNGSPSTLNLTATSLRNISIEASEFNILNIDTINLTNVNLYIKKLNFDQPTLTVNQITAGELIYQENISVNSLVGDVSQDNWDSSSPNGIVLNEVSTDAELRALLLTPLIGGANVLDIKQTVDQLQLTAGDYNLHSSIEFISYKGSSDAVWIGELGAGGMKFASSVNVIWSFYNTQLVHTGPPQDWELDNIQMECRTLSVGFGVTYTFTGSGVLGYEKDAGTIPVTGDIPFQVFWDNTLGGAGLNTDVVINNSTLTGSTVTDVFDNLIVDVDKSVKANILSTGWQDGFTMTQNTPTSIDVDLGSGVWVDNFTDPLNPIVERPAYSGDTNLTIPNIATTVVTYVGVELVASVPTIVFKNNLAFTDSERRTTVVLGFIVHFGGVINSISNEPQTCIDLRQFSRDIAEAIGPISLGGINYSGASANNLELQNTAGNIFLIDVSWLTTPKTPNRAPYSAADPIPFFNTAFQDATQPTGFNFQIKTAIVPSAYDDGTGPDGGDPTIPAGTVSTNRWQIMRIWIAPATGQTAVAYGQETYTNLSDAEGAIQSEVFNAPLESQDFLGRAWLLVRGGASDLNDSGDAKFITAGKFGFTGAGGGGQSTSTTNFQETYENSGLNPQILLDNIRGAFGIIDGVVPITGDLFYVRDNAQTQDFIAVDTQGIRSVKGTFQGMGALGPNLHLDDNLVEPTVKNNGDWFRIGSDSTIVGDSFKLINTIDDSAVEFLNNPSPAGGALLLKDGGGVIDAILRSYAISAIQLSLSEGGIDCLSKIIINHITNDGQHELNTGASGAFQRTYDNLGVIGGTLRAYAAAGQQGLFTAGGFEFASGGSLFPHFRLQDGLVKPSSPQNRDIYAVGNEIYAYANGSEHKLSDIGAGANPIEKYAFGRWFNSSLFTGVAIPSLGYDEEGSADPLVVSAATSAFTLKKVFFRCVTWASTSADLNININGVNTLIGSVTGVSHDFTGLSVAVAQGDDLKMIFTNVVSGGNLKGVDIQIEGDL